MSVSRRANGLATAEQLFPKTLAAICAADKCLWRIGDALVSECGRLGSHGVNSGVRDKLAKFADALERRGFPEYSLDHLLDLRQTSAKFRERDRSPSVSWTVHSLAGDVATLRDAQKRAKREGKPLTCHYMRNFKARRGREQQQRQRATTEVNLETILSDFNVALANAEEQVTGVLRHIEPNLGDLSADQRQQAISRVQPIANACTKLLGLLRPATELAQAA
jgi:hypothetical protein